MNCECDAAGFCKRYNKMQAERSYQICQGIVLTPEKCAVYRSNWAKLASAAKASGLPGTELKKLLAKLGIKDFAGCSCKQHVAQMNAWGVNGCRENFATIRGWIAESQAKAGWLTTITATTRAATSGLVLQIDPMDVAGSLVRLAIERAAQKNTTTPAAPSPTDTCPKPDR